MATALQMDSHAAQEFMGKQISPHESAILNLGTLGNTHTGISTLPVEILSEIFLLAKLPPGILYRERHQNRGWLNVAGVCRSWREITLNTPLMWDTLNMSKLNTLDWAETLIARSKDVPLHVSCTYPHRATPRAVLDLVFSHIERFQDLEISLDTSLNAKIQDILDLRGQSCVLRSLALYNHRPLFSDGNGGIGRFLSEAQMPLLRTLDVSFFGLPHTISVLPQLRDLRYMPPARRTTVAAMLSFLRSTPSLERLEILGPLGPPDSNGGEEMSMVELMKLSLFSYITPESGDTSLVRFLHYPPSLRVKFSSPIPPFDTATCANDLASILTRAASSDVAAAIDEISFAVTDGAYFDMQMSGHDGAMLEIHLRVAEGQLLPLLELPAMLPKSNARTLLIRGCHSVTVADWVSIFARHAQIRDLAAADVDSNFLRALSKPSENEPPPFTHLKSLRLSYCDLEEHMALVKRVLAERSQLEAGIGVTIKIERCTVAGDSIRELEAYAKIEWDGIEEFIAEPDQEYEHDDEESD